MSNLETTELKLTTTPTGGVDAAQSPYYRLLLSAGYKGFLQGTVGGAALYGTFGLVVSALTAIPLALFGLGTAALAIIPAATTFGVFKGATTFGNIGSVAAISAESAELSEQRRYLLDRYYDLPEGPAGDKEAEIIKQELLKRQNDAEKPKHIFHWKTVLIGAILGTALVLGGLYFSGILSTIAPAIGASMNSTALATASGALTTFLEKFGIHMTIEALAPIIAAGAVGTAGAIVGGLAGATIGIDRFYIRKWFDHTQSVVHSSGHTESALMERQEQINRLKKAASEDQQSAKAIKVEAVEPPSPTHAAIAPAPEAKIEADKPTHTISAARRQGMVEIQKAMGLANA